MAKDRDVKLSPVMDRLLSVAPSLPMEAERSETPASETNQSSQTGGKRQHDWLDKKLLARHPGLTDEQLEQIAQMF